MAAHGWRRQALKGVKCKWILQRRLRSLATLCFMELIISPEKNNRTGNEAHCFFRFDADYLASLGSAQFTASAYASAQAVMNSGGRGAAWFVESEAGPAVLKHYRRGGVMARFSRDSYLFTSLEHSRAFAEFNVLQTLQAKALPVPTPLAAFCCRDAFTYRAALLTQRINSAKSFAQQCRQEQPAWEAVGTVLARFHSFGAEHRDLNAENILFDDSGAVYLIDWDKGRLHAGPGAWCDTVLARLRRSLDKLQALGDVSELDAGWKRLLDAYQEGIQ